MKKNILFVVCLLFGLMFINAGLNKFFNYMPMPKDIPGGMMKAMGAMMEIKWLMPLIAVGEVVGGLLFLFRQTRALGALIIFPIMIGIVLTNIMYAPSGLPLTLVMLLINIWVILENWNRYTPMISNYDSRKL